jgi:hypothetical protein
LKQRQSIELPLNSFRFILAAGLLALVLAACARSAGSGNAAGETAAGQTTIASQPTQTPRSGASFPTATSPPQPTDTPEPSPTPTLTPTPIAPTLNVRDQPVGEEGLLNVERVAVPAPSWVVVYTADGEVIGQAAVDGGVHADVSITVDPLATTPNMIARLHTDAEPVGTFAFPGEDEPLDIEAASFEVTLDLPNPAVQVSDQNVGEDGVIHIESIYVPDPAWLLIRNNEDDEIGVPIGQFYLEAGLHENLPIAIRWREATPQLFAALHEDEERTQRLDYPEADLPLLVDGEPVAASFHATFPPDILVYDQPVIDGQVVIERVISNGPGWIVVHLADENGAPGFVIGHAPLEDGLNERIPVQLIEEAITPILYTRIHEDTVPGDDFNYPAVDGPVRVNGRLPHATPINTEMGCYLIAADQPLDEEGIATLSLVTCDVPAWAVIYTDEDGQPGFMLGRVWLGPGINRQVSIEVHPDLIAEVTERIHVVLHQDSDEPEVFDFPGGADVPLIRNRAQVAITLQLHSPSDTAP